YLMFFNQPEMKDTLSEGMEMLRLDLGPKMNHLTIISQALREQSRNSDAQRIDGYIKRIDDQTKNHLQRVESLFKENVDCAILHAQVESTMRTYFFQKEIEYVKSTYEALRL